MPPGLLVQFKWGGRCLTIEPKTCKATYSNPCPLVLGSCADNISHWTERPQHITHGTSSANAINIDCKRQTTGAVAKLLGSSPSSIVWKPTEVGVVGSGQLEAGGKLQLCLNNGEGKPEPPCGSDKALPAQIKLAPCINVSTTSGWVRIVV